MTTPDPRGDVDGDGDQDVVVAHGEADLTVLLNLGDGTFAEPLAWEEDSPLAVSLRDLDGDADLDIAVANRNTNSVSILLNGCIPQE